MYRSAREVWHGLAKNATEGLAQPALLVPATALLVGGQVLPVVLCSFGVFGKLSPWAAVLAALGLARRLLPPAARRAALGSHGSGRCSTHSASSSSWCCSGMPVSGPCVASSHLERTGLQPPPRRPRRRIRSSSWWKECVHVLPRIGEKHGCMGCAGEGLRAAYGKRTSYTMKVVARRTGLSPHVIRMWEKRYGVVAPARTDTRRRLYTEADITRLGLLRQATLLGYTISRIAFPTDQLQALVNAEADCAAGAADTAGPSRPSPGPVVLRGLPGRRATTRCRGAGDDAPARACHAQPYRLS